MISERQIREILTQYEKHGWSLRRVLLSAKTAESISASLFGGSPIVFSEIDALWFSRISKDGRETWEIRHLSNTPFALVAVFETAGDEAAREQMRRELETRLAKSASKPEQPKP